MSKRNDDTVPAYMNGEGDMITLAKLQDAALIAQTCLSGVAIVLGAFQDSIIFKISLEQQALLSFVTDSLRMNSEKLGTIIPDRSDQEIEYIRQDADE